MGMETEFSRNSLGPMQERQQLLFRDVAVHMIRQGERSSNTEGECKYWYGDLKCAVGCLIKDEHYSSAFEDLTVNSAEVSGAIEKSIGRKLQDEDLEMLNLLQNVHDFDHPEEWKLQLKGVGLRYFNKDLHQLNVLRGF